MSARVNPLKPGLVTIRVRIRCTNNSHVFMGHSYSASVDQRRCAQPHSRAHCTSRGQAVEDVRGRSVVRVRFRYRDNDCPVRDWRHHTLAAPWYVVLVLPILFTAGMTLVDTLDGVIMHRAYAWAVAAPVRKVYYNLTITLISVAVAFLVGGIGISSLAAEPLHGNAGLPGWLAGLDVENLGYAIVAVLVFTWLAAAAWWRIAKVASRYSGDAGRTAGA